MKGEGTEGVVRFRENCFVRAAPSAAGAVLGVAKRGDALPFAGEATGEGWIAVAAGKALDRKGNPLTIKMKGKVEPFYR